MIRLLICVACLGCMGFVDCEVERDPHATVRDTRSNGITYSTATVVRSTSTLVADYEDNRNSMTYEAWCQGSVILENVSDQERRLIYHIRIPVIYAPWEPSMLNGFCYESETRELVYHIERDVPATSSITVEFDLAASWQDYNPGGADLNGDFAVNSYDLGILLTFWGECVDCVADLNGDGVVDIQDQSILLANWTDSHE